MKLIYDVQDRPQFKELIVFAFQQVLAIMTATIAVPLIVRNGLSASAALFGAGVGTLVYIAFTRKKSPVFLGSSFAFIGSMSAAFAGAASASAGFAGIILGAILAGLVYVIFAVIIKRIGVGWVNNLMPPVVIGPTVAIIGLSLAGNAIGDLGSSYAFEGVNNWAVLCGLVALFSTMFASTFGRKHIKLVPFIIGIFTGYVFALILTLIGNATGNPALQIVNFATFAALVENGVTLSTFLSVPDFTFLKAISGLSDVNFGYFLTIFAAYVPVALVVFAEHIADHKNISSIIGRDLLTEPGLDKSLLGDGIGSMVGAFFGGCPNTTYGESIACVAITKNASVMTIMTAAIECIILSFLSPFVALIGSIPSCVMGGVCMALYGFIAVSGLKMIKDVDLDDNHNLFVVSTILIAGIGGLTLTFGNITITSVACALILGIIVNRFLGHSFFNR